MTDGSRSGVVRTMVIVVALAIGLVDVRPAQAQTKTATAIGAAVLGTATGIGLVAWCSRECEGGDAHLGDYALVFALGSLPGAVVGAGAGYVLGETLTDGTFEPGLSFETGYVWGVDGSDGASPGFRAAPFVATTGRLSTHIEYARFGHDRVGQIRCPGGDCGAAPIPSVRNGHWNALALVERVTVGGGERNRLQFIFGLGYAWDVSKESFECADTTLCVSEFEEDTMHLTTGLAADWQLFGNVWAGGQLRWEPAFGESAWSLQAGLSIR